MFEDFVLDSERRELRRGGGLVAVEPKVFDLLVHLVANRERVVSKDDLIAAVWKGRIVSESAVTTAINAARTVLGDSGETQRLIKTLPRKGFRFVGEVQEGSGTDAPAVAQPKEAGGPNSGLASNASLAVLPFTNLSGEIEQEYFADGITDDVITELSRSRELFVIARNSSFQYRGEAADIRRIGSELGVRYVLEGSVRRSGQRVRVNVQLVDASTGVHLWAERYDREIADVLAIQIEVARAIVPMLVAHVTMAELERSATRPPTTWEAYDHLVKGLALLRTFQSTFGKDDLDNARASFERALQLDPGTRALTRVVHPAGCRRGYTISIRTTSAKTRSPAQRKRRGWPFSPMRCCQRLGRSVALLRYGSGSTRFRWKASSGRSRSIPTSVSTVMPPRSPMMGS